MATTRDFAEVIRAKMAADPTLAAMVEAELREIVPPGSPPGAIGLDMEDEDDHRRAVGELMGRILGPARTVASACPGREPTLAQLACG